jgi:hypothetical protein
LPKTMPKLRQRRPRVKLGPEEYDSLRHRVLERDGWRCQSCGSSKDLHVHHLRKRSDLGDDALDNLITLCVSLSLAAASRLNPDLLLCLRNRTVWWKRDIDVAHRHTRSQQSPDETCLRPFEAVVNQFVVERAFLRQPSRAKRQPQWNRHFREYRASTLRQ